MSAEKVIMSAEKVTMSADKGAEVTMTVRRITFQNCPDIMSGHYTIDLTCYEIGRTLLYIYTGHI